MIQPLCLRSVLKTFKRHGIIEHYISWLQVTMNPASIVHMAYPLQKLNRQASYQVDWHALRILCFRIETFKLVHNVAEVSSLLELHTKNYLLRAFDLEDVE
jgi:hypothetical protein